MEGKYLFEAAGERFEAPTGDFVFVPRHIPHRFLNIGKTAGTMPLTLEPGGLEVFLRRARGRGWAAVSGGGGTSLREVWLELLGPSLGDE